ncbi:MAG: type 1 glutamine amidotransferase [Alphaproteobacteria bacterium]|nr:type 1 glutamine amidotransferase [Alphaproteobacteria bacterium]
MSPPLRILVVDGNPAADRARLAVPIDGDLAVQLSRTLAPRRPGLQLDVHYPCDGAASPADLTRYDGAIFTGSVLHAYDDTRDVAGQARLVRALLQAGTPVFGLCWGLQIGCVALGGRVMPDPEGPEIGLARDVALSEAGRADPVLRHRPATFDSHAWHLDAVVEPPAGAVVLATNGRSRIQALRVAAEGATFMGVQYHPEYSCAEFASMGRAFRPEPSVDTLPNDDALALEPLRWLDTLARRG